MREENKKHTAGNTGSRKSYGEKTPSRKEGGKNLQNKKAMDEKPRSRKETTQKPQTKHTMCPYFSRCGGCQYIDLPYEKQLAQKHSDIKKLLGDFGRVEPVIGMERPFYYRHKVHAVFGYEKGQPISGIYEEKSHRLVKIDSCRIENQKADEIILSIRSLLKSFKIHTYDEKSDYGLLKHVVVRVARGTGQIMVILVLRSPILPSKNNFAKALLKLHPEITTIVINVNDKRTTMVLGKRDIVLYGKGYIEDTLCGVSFRLSPQSFYQVNPQQTEVLYEKAMELAGLKGREMVIDTYCGIGTIALIAAKRAGKVLGIELNGEAVKDARENARRGDFHNVEFLQADAGQAMMQMAENGKAVDVVFMDPPRSGSDEAFLEAVCRLAPEKLIYISCGPQSLARDLAYLTRHGFAVKKIQPIDLFPQTVHVETVVLLSKGEIDSKKIKVEFSLEDMDMSSFQNGATYAKIKERVLKQSGLKVSSLYIAQVKQKCGIIERENFNKAKSEDAKQPKCPPEKEKAIMEALKHFRMI